MRIWALWVPTSDSAFEERWVASESQASSADLASGRFEGAKTLFIEPGSPWENGYIESFNGKLRDELLNGEIFDTITEARVITERWRKHYNTRRPHSSLGYKPPTPETYIFPQAANA